MKKYWKDVLQTFSSSKGRVFSIIALMTLGSFALVGLKVTSPSMETTAENFFKKHNTADVFVIGDFGLDKSDEELINQVSNKADIEYGYFKDVTIESTTKALRIFSKPKAISTYEVVEGRMPKRDNEVAISNAYADKYDLGDTITFEEIPDDEGAYTLKRHDYKITGFINSSEIISKISQGNSLSGSGRLQGYGVVTNENFDSDVYMVARLRYKDLVDKDPFSQDYIDQVNAEKKVLASLLINQPDKRLKDVKQDKQESIDEGQKEVDEAKNKLDTGEQTLKENREKIKDGKTQLASKKDEISRGESKLNGGMSQLEATDRQLKDAKGQLDGAQLKLSREKSKLGAAERDLSNGSKKIAQAEQELAKNESKLQEAKSQLDSGRSLLEVKEEVLGQARKTLDQKQGELADARKALDGAKVALDLGRVDLDRHRSELNRLRIKYESLGLDPYAAPDYQLYQGKVAKKEGDYQVLQEAYHTKEGEFQYAKETLASKEEDYRRARQELNQKKAELKTKEAQTQEASKQLEAGKASLSSKKRDYEEGRNRYNSGKSQLADAQGDYQRNYQKYQSGLNQYNGAKRDLNKKKGELDRATQLVSKKDRDLKEAEETLDEKEKEFYDEKPGHEKEIQDAQKEVQEAQNKLDHLDIPGYEVFSRREAPGSGGYISYENAAKIIRNLGNILPILLYLVAALVTATTMTRFVDEERLKAGIFKALGYKERDIINKFVIYGAVNSIIGSVIGISLGHLFLPRVIYNAYKDTLIVAPIEVGFYPTISVISLILGLISAVLPAYLVAKRELSEKPASLLLPKAPVSGEKILLERIQPLWSRLSFTHKVTARNIFRYKKRMMMTLLGVGGSVLLIFIGLGVLNSLKDLSTRQFSEIIKYDLIVADKNYLSEDEQKAQEDLLESRKIKDYMPIHYQVLTKNAGKQMDEQQITLISDSEDYSDDFRDYIDLRDAKTREEITDIDSGVSMSKKIADLLGVKVGDTVTLLDSNKKEVEVEVASISELYMGHFVFLSNDYYEDVFGEQATDNAHLVQIKNGTASKTERIADDFMNLSSTKGVVQSTSMRNDVQTIVDSLSNVMIILVGSSVLLAIVILYNLNNINVAEKTRELSTLKVLGFHDKEVTLYIYRETILLSSIGILLGFILGYGFYIYILNTIPPDFVYFNRDLIPSNFYLPALLIFMVLLVLWFVVNKYLKKLDMLEALKSVE